MKRGLVSLGVIFGVIFLAAVLGQIGVFRVRESALNAVRTMLFLLLLAFLGYAHMGDIMALFRMAGSKVQEVSDKSAKRGQKAGEAIKTLEKLADQLDEAAKQSEDAKREVLEQEPPAGR